jgi:hypothetical protein
MSLPVRVGDTITNEYSSLPCTVTRVDVVEPMTNEDRETYQWLGYTLGHYDEPCIYIEYKIPGSKQRGSVKVHMETDTQGRLVTMINPDSWAGGRYTVVKGCQKQYIQQELFA